MTRIGCTARICDVCIGLCAEIFGEQLAAARGLDEHAFKPPAVNAPEFTDHLSKVTRGLEAEQARRNTSIGQRGDRCSFCSHSAPRIVRLISGPHVFICDGCVMASALAFERAHLRVRYGTLYDELESLLFRLDPMGLDYEDNTDEYNPEVRKILPRLEHCTSIDDVTDMLLDVFTRMFDAKMAGPRSIYERIAPEVWNLWATCRAPKS